MNPNILVTICARGGSKGVKNKNIRRLCGRPLIAYTIRQALKWKRPTSVVVSTDSPAIAKVAADCGAFVPFLRPKNLAGDKTPKVDAIRHALVETERILNKKYSCVVDLDVTAPIRKVSDLEGCYRKFLKQKPLTLFSVTPAHKNPYFNMVEEDKNGFARLCKKLARPVYCRQDAPSVYGMNGCIYIYQRDYLLDPSNRGPWTRRSVIYVMDDWCGFDIDRETDFKFMEFLVREGIVKL